MFACDFLIICFPRLLFCTLLLSKYWGFFCVTDYLGLIILIWALKLEESTMIRWSTRDLFYGWVEYKRLKSAVFPKHVEHIQIFIPTVNFHSYPCSPNFAFMNFLFPLPLNKNMPFLQSLPPPRSLLWPHPFPLNADFLCALIYFSCYLMFLVCMSP